MNSVEPPLALQKQRRTILPDATNDNHQLAVFMKAQHSQVSIRYSDKPACQMPRACDYNISICTNMLQMKTFSKTRVGTMIKIAPRLDPRIYILKSYCSKDEIYPYFKVAINEDDLTLRLQCTHAHPAG